jgi:Putative transposase DNA-binding domain
VIQRQLKLRLSRAQETRLREWLWILTGAWNFASRRLELDAKDGIFHSKFEFRNQAANSSERLGNHYQLRQMLSYKSPAGGTEYVEVDSKFSTRICSSCGAPKGPQGLAGLSVRHWGCSSCGATHDRDVNAAVNTLNVGLGRSHEKIPQGICLEAA